jgi:hypothetical protein
VGGIVITAIFLYILFPTLTSVYESLRVQPLNIWWVLLAVVWTPLVGCAFAIMGAPWAKAYRDLVQADVSRTFA